MYNIGTRELEKSHQVPGIICSTKETHILLLLMVCMVQIQMNMYVEPVIRVVLNQLEENF
jgi:hypothetical protein